MQEQQEQQEQKERNITFSGGLKAADLQGFIKRVENLETNKKNIMEDIKVVKADAKSAGFNPKIITAIVKLRGRDAHEVEEEEILIDLYKRALGME